MGRKLEVADFEQVTVVEPNGNTFGGTPSDWTWTQEVRSGSVGNTGTIDYAYNAADQLTQTTKSGQTTTYTYDSNGNQASIGARTFTYDLADELVSTTSAGTTTTYSYDGDGRRISSTLGGGGADLRLVWDPLAASGLPEPALERTPAGALVRRYLTGPLGPFSFTNASVTFSYHRDTLCTVTDVTDASGAAQWKYDYEAYGAERMATNVSGSAPESRLRFDGQYLDPEATQYHLRARQYDPATGRFGALDPVENSPSAPHVGAYVYVDGRLTVLVDPLGLYSWKDFKRDATGAADAVAIIGDFRSHVEFWGDQARAGAERDGVSGFAQYFTGRGADFLISPFAEIQTGTETLWDPCSSGWDKAKAAGSIGLGMASLTPPGRGVRAGAAARAAAKAGTGAESAVQGALLREHLRLTEKYGTAGVRDLENGRIRYYGEIRPARTPGEMVGQRTVRQWDPATGRQRTWLETVDQQVVFGLCVLRPVARRRTTTSTGREATVARASAPPPPSRAEIAARISALIEGAVTREAIADWAMHWVDARDPASMTQSPGRC